MEKWKIHNYGIEAIFHQIFDDFGREFLQNGSNRTSLRRWSAERIDYKIAPVLAELNRARAHRFWEHAFKDQNLCKVSELVHVQSVQAWMSLHCFSSISFPQLSFQSLPSNSPSFFLFYDTVQDKAQFGLHGTLITGNSKFAWKTKK